MTTDLTRNDKRRSATLEQVNRLAWLLDNSIQIPLINYRIGLDAIIGLIPGLGDATGLVVSSVIVIQAIRLGAPKATLVRMVLNIAIEALVGLIPMLGDVFDATFKSNARNVRLLNLAVANGQADYALGKAAGKGAIIAVIAALVGIIVVIGGVGIAVFWGLVSLFTQ